MKFNLKIIACKLDKIITETHISYNNRTLLSARLLTPGTAPFDKSAVYIVRSEDIPSLWDTDLPENLICVGRGDLQPVIEAKKYNLLVVDGGNPIVIHNEVQRIFDFYNEIDADLTNAILCENDLQSILDICTRFFDNPVYIIDSAQKLIACSSNMNDPEWNAVKAVGYLTVDVIDQLKRLDLLRNKTHGPQLINAESIPPFLVVGIIENDEKIGAVGVRQLYSKISENQLSLLQHIADVLTAAVSKVHYARYVKANQANRFMLDILGGTSYEVNFIIHNLSQLGWKIDDEYYIFRILPDPKDIEGDTVKYSGELIKNMFAGSVLLELGNELALIVNTRYCGDTLVEAFEHLSDFLQKRNFICGVSTLFRDFSWLFEQYKLAHAAINIGSLMDRDIRIFRYTKYIMPHMISLCDQVFNVNMLCHREAIKLHKYDKVNNKNYFYCLYLYLLNERSLLTTSKNLNIHRSTLIYRLNKISEIIRIELNDQEARMHMVYSYEILHFLDCLRNSADLGTLPPSG